MILKKDKDWRKKCTDGLVWFESDFIRCSLFVSFPILSKTSLFVTSHASSCIVLSVVIAEYSVDCKFGSQVVFVFVFEFEFEFKSSHDRLTTNYEVRKTNYEKRRKHKDSKRKSSERESKKICLSFNYSTTLVSWLGVGVEVWAGAGTGAGAQLELRWNKKRQGGYTHTQWETERKRERERESAERSHLGNRKGLKRCPLNWWNRFSDDWWHQ